MQVPVSVTGPVGSLALQYTGSNADRVIEFVGNCIGAIPSFAAPDVLQYPIIGGMRRVVKDSWLVWDTQELHCLDSVYFNKSFTVLWNHPQEPVVDPKPEVEGGAIVSYAINESTIAPGLEFIHHLRGQGSQRVKCVESAYLNMDHPLYGNLVLVWLHGEDAHSVPVGELTDTSEFTMTYQGAIEAGKQGHRVYRKGWNGADLSLTYVPEAEVSTKGTRMAPFFGDTMPMRAHWLLKTAQGDVDIWSPSLSDSLAEDWAIYSPE
ncbi:methionyl-tRNA synthetase [Vibrio phage vB_VpaS_KF4]|nr:methionyl-tRNA synthetase [Vibrio phage vB_VpaS_KF3]ATI19224.1 methionyl-tRNA synthetase [Vibrio phage vB_VpaS_KF4]